MDDETLILIAYIKNAPTREKVLKSFESEDYLRSIQISRKTDLHPNNIIKLKDLREHEVVYVIIPSIMFQTVQIYLKRQKFASILVENQPFFNKTLGFMDMYVHAFMVLKHFSTFKKT